MVIVSEGYTEVYSVKYEDEVHESSKSSSSTGVHGHSLLIMCDLVTAWDIPEWGAPIQGDGEESER